MYSSGVSAGARRRPSLRWTRSYSRSSSDSPGAAFGLRLQRRVRSHAHAKTTSTAIATATGIVATNPSEPSAARVRVRAQNVKGEWFELDGEELLARAFQHEIDHLHGILFFSRVSMLKRDLILRRIRKLQRDGEW